MMDGLSTSCSAGGRFLLLPPPSTSTPAITRKQSNTFSFSRRRLPSFPIASSSRDGSSPELNQWEQMELKFGKLIGEDPQLTLEKVKARKLNPDASFIEIEKAFNKKKNKKKKGGSAENDEPVEVPLDWAVEKQNQKKERQQQQLQQNEEQLQQLQKLSSSMGLRAPTRGGKKSSLSPKLNLTRPENVNFSKDSSVEEDDPPVTTNLNSDLDLQSSGKGVSGPNISLRKPEVVKGDDIELEKPRFQIKPNIQLKMRKGGHDEELGEVNLLKKPEVVKISLGSPGDNNISETNSKISADKSGIPVSSTSYDVTEQSDVESLKVESGISENFNLNSIQEDHESTPKPANLIGKPQRMDSLPKELPHPLHAKISTPDDAVKYDASDEFLVSSEQEEKEEGDWQRAKDLLQTGDRVEVEFISGSKRGLVVSFGSLVGFLPYRNLGAKWKFLAFESWLRKRGLDPSLYRRNLSIVSNYPVQNQDLSSSSNESQDQEKVIGEKLGLEMKFEDLLEQYDQEKTKFLSSFVGQRTKVVVTMVDQKSRRLMFSGRPKEKEEEVEKKRSVMAKLSVGDIVKCCIKKITYFGIFVEIEGAPALIHQSEVSWDTALDPNDPTSSFKIGQMIDAKVHQLDYVLERITLSLKEITPDPLRESLESVIEDGIEASQKDVEWADVESLIRELEQIEGVAVVSKGRFFLSPGLAPTFQVYMASMHENRYKLLARFENKVQEVIVQTSLDKDEMKSAILTCTNKFEHKWKNIASIHNSRYIFGRN